MKLSEVVISLLIVCVLSGSLLSAYNSFEKGNDRLNKSFKENREILQTDCKIRKDIKSFEIYFYDNFDFKVEEFAEKYFSIYEEKGIQVQKISKKIDESGNCTGIRVEWKKGEKTFETAESFSAISVIKK